MGGGSRGVAGGQLILSLSIYILIGSLGPTCLAVRCETEQPATYQGVIYPFTSYFKLFFGKMKICDLINSESTTFSQIFYFFSIINKLRTWERFRKGFKIPMPDGMTDWNIDKRTDCGFNILANTFKGVKKEP